MKKVCIIIPCYNEENHIRLISERISESISRAYTYEIIFVDDGSRDNTLLRIKELASEKPEVIRYLSFSKNFGHQYALIAGMEFAEGDCVIMMDADMQHPPELINDMLAKWEEGYDIVYTLRKNDKNLSFFKRITSKLFYKILNFLSDINLEEGAADFRLLDRKVLNVFKNHLGESSVFLRGLINWVGFRKYAIAFTPGKRYSGKTKYSLKKMFNFAVDGITSFSIKPLRMAIVLGFLLAFASFCYGVYAVIMHFTSKAVVGGWTSTILSILFIGGVVILILGIIGEYIGKIYFEVKKRPRYIIRESSYE